MATSCFSCHGSLATIWFFSDHIGIGSRKVVSYLSSLQFVVKLFIDINGKEKLVSEIKSAKYYSTRINSTSDINYID